MTDLAIRVAAAATLIWLGMVLAISFLEAPLKFRPEGLELRVGLAIGRVVFRALNIAEYLGGGHRGMPERHRSIRPGARTRGGDSGAVGRATAGGRPRLNRRSAPLLAGHEAPRSRAHHAYLGWEALKLAALVALGAALLAA